MGYEIFEALSVKTVVWLSLKLFFFQEDSFEVHIQKQEVCKKWIKGLKRQKLHKLTLFLPA